MNKNKMVFCVRQCFVMHLLCHLCHLYTEYNDKYEVVCLFIPYLNRQSTYAGQVKNSALDPAEKYFMYANRSA